MVKYFFNATACSQTGCSGPCRQRSAGALRDCSREEESSGPPSTEEPQAAELTKPHLPCTLPFPHAVFSSLCLERSLTTGPSQPCPLPDLCMTSRYWRPLGPSARSSQPILACPLPVQSFLCFLLFPVCGASLPTLFSAQCTLTNDLGSVSLAPDSHACMGKFRQVWDLP